MALKPGYTVCETCSKHAPEATFTYTEFGQKLCRGCHAEFVSKKATRQQRRSEEYRRCPACRKVMSPNIEMSTDSDDEAIPVVVRRHYDCTCGHSFSTLSWYALLMLAIGGAFAAFIGGRAFRNDDAEQILIGGVGLAVVSALLLWEAYKRWRHPRVLS